MSIRTDLAIESADTGDGRLPDGVFTEVDEKNGLKITTVRIDTEEASERLGRAVGKYVTIEGSFDIADAAEVGTAISGALGDMLPKGSVMVCGLGNTEVTPDALGPKAASRVLATRHIGPELQKQVGLGDLRPVSVMSPGVLGQTGIESAEIISAVAEDVSPDALIVVDALAARSLSRLGNTIQVSNTGIAPGAGVKNARKELSQKNLGIPVIAIGIPTVVDGATLVQDLTGADAGGKAHNLMVTPRDVDNIVDRGASLIARGINSALQPGLDDETIGYLMS